MASRNENKGKSAHEDPLRDDPLREESTDFRGPGKKFEIAPEGENLDLSKMDQPRHNPESLPKAHKQKTRAPARGAGGKVEKKKDRAA